MKKVDGAPDPSGKPRSIKKQPIKKKTNYSWAIKIIFVSIFISIIFTLASGEIMANAGYLLAFTLLLVFIFIGIIFDIVGVAVTYANEKPFHSMASHKEKGAAEAIKLIKNAEKVSNFCNDVVGDISGIVSGTTSAVIVARLLNDFGTETIFLQLAMSGIVAGLTIGGKAFGKTFAINKSVKIVHFTARIIRLVKIKRGKSQ